MSWSLTIGRFGATTLRVHLTFFLVLAWIGVSAWLKGGAPAARDSVLFIALIFGCVVLHEFGHILMAKVLDGGGEEEFILRSERPAQPPRCIENSSRIIGLASIG